MTNNLARRSFLLATLGNLALLGCDPAAPPEQNGLGGSSGQGGAGGDGGGGMGGSGGQGGGSTAYCGKTLQDEFAAAVAGLLYLSEGDNPFEVFLETSPGTGPVAPNELGALLGLPTGTVYEVRILESFFTPFLLTGPDGARYKALRDLLVARLIEPRVIRFDVTQVKVYLVGRTSCGEVAGVNTISIET